MNQNTIDAIQYSDYSLEDLRQYFGRFDEDKYELDFGGLASGTSQEKVLQFKTDSLFVWEKWFQQTNFVGSVPTQGTMPYSNVRVQLEVQASGRPLFSEPVYLSSVCGITGFPFELPVCRYFEANERLTVTLFNDGSSADLNIKLTFMGKRYFGEA